MKLRSLIAAMVCAGILLAASLQKAAAEINNNTTFQAGQVNINRTSQCGETNSNTTYQEGRVNINQTSQAGCTSRGRGKRGSPGHDTRSIGRPAHAAAGRR